MKSRQHRHVRHLAIALCAFSIVNVNQVHAALVFDNTNSTVVFTHDIGGGVITPNTISLPTAGPIPVGTAGFPFSSTIVDGTVFSTARAGFGQITTPVFGTGIVAPGTLVTQSDPLNASVDFSTLSIDFDLRWQNTATNFGPPILGTFTLPLLAVVGANGQAKADLNNIQWKNLGGTDLRPSATVNSPVFGPGVHFTALTVPPALFNPLLLPAGDELRVSGEVLLSTKNADGPVFFYPEVPSLKTLIDDIGLPDNGVAPGIVIHFELAEDSPGGSPATGTIDGSINGDTPVAFGFYNNNPNYVNGLPNNPNNAAVRFGSTQSAQVFVQTFESFTFEAFFASDSASSFLGNGVLFGNEDDSGFIVRTVNGTNQIVVELNSNSFTPGEFVMPTALVQGDLTEFHHLALSFDQNTGEALLFIDGVLASSADFGSPVPLLRESANPFVADIGVDFNGTIDEIVYYEGVIDRAFIDAVRVLGFIDPTQVERFAGAGIGVGGIPEPTTALLGVMGLAGLGVGGRRRRRAAA